MGVDKASIKSPMHSTVRKLREKGEARREGDFFYENEKKTGEEGVNRKIFRQNMNL